jgi:hypothetical protein
MSTPMIHKLLDNPTNLARKQTNESVLIVNVWIDAVRVEFVALYVKLAFIK